MLRDLPPPKLQGRIDQPPPLRRARTAIPARRETVCCSYRYLYEYNGPFLFIVPSALMPSAFYLVCLPAHVQIELACCVGRRASRNPALSYCVALSTGSNTFHTF